MAASLVKLHTQAMVFTLLALVACGGEKKTSLLLDVRTGEGMTSEAEALRVYLTADNGDALFDDERLPREGQLQPLSFDRLGSVVLYLGDAAGTLELNVFATKGGARIGRGRTIVNATAGKQNQATITLLPTAAWPDTESLLDLGPNGEPCAGHEQCLSGACIDGVCCGQNRCGTCQACNLPGNAGTCAPIPVGESDVEPAQACTGEKACDGQGSCRSRRGEACQVAADCATGHCVDGVCCAQACIGGCESCGEVGGGGLCRPRAAGAEPSNEECPGIGLCDGQGGCKPACKSSAQCEPGHACLGGVCMPLVADGEACTDSVQCTSGSCVDGRCCKASCGTCMACTGPGGTCEPRPAGGQDQAPHLSCSGKFSCNGQGGCGLSVGQRCDNKNQCATGHCASGICCDSACTGPCQNCGGGVCKPIINAVDPRGCSGSQMCDGQGSCRKINGTRCGSAGECASGHCVDGACCNTACDESCYACGSGTCTLKVNTTDPQCTGGRRCDSAGLCR